MNRLAACLFSLLVIASPALAGDAATEADDFRTASPEGAVVYIIAPANGEVVTSPVTVKFGLKGMGVAPAGADFENTGHHHLMIDRALPSLDENLPAEDNLIHFGGGQTETIIDLEPGTHTLQLIMGDQNHIPHKPPVISEPVTIVVTE